MDEEVEGTAIPSRPARKLDFLIIGLELAKDLAASVADVARAVEDAFDMASMVACQHANHLVDQARTHAQMTRELETLLEGDE